MIWNIINLGQTQREINSYSIKLIIVKMTFQLRRFDSTYKKLWKLKPWKEHVLKKYKTKYKMLSIRSKFCLILEATTYGKSTTTRPSFQR